MKGWEFFLFFPHYQGFQGSSLSFLFEPIPQTGFPKWDPRSSPGRVRPSADSSVSWNQTVWKYFSHRRLGFIVFDRGVKLLALNFFLFRGINSTLLSFLDLFNNVWHNARIRMWFFYHSFFIWIYLLVCVYNFASSDPNYSILRQRSSSRPF